MMSTRKHITRDVDERLMLSSMIEKKMEPLMGVLSKFIVKKAFDRNFIGREKQELEMDNLIDEIIDESKLLLGPKRTEELKEELKNMLSDHYQEE